MLETQSIDRSISEPVHQASIFKPCFSTMSSSFRAMPLGRLAPLSHFSTVDSAAMW
jgi:hypothetical protein